MTEDLTSPADPVASYWTGQIHDSHPALLAAYAAESQTAVATFRPDLDVRYGPHAREVFDVYRATGEPRGVLVYYHGGYWQARSKDPFGFIAPAFLAAGIDVVLPNYPLCPEVSLEALVASVRSGIPAIIAHLHGRRTDRMVVSGHSAGGHLATELALTDWGAEHPVAGLLAISGVYELTPLLHTPINAKLGLDPARAAAMSPLRRVRGTLPNAVFAAGSLETEAFRAQSAQMDAAWRGQGGRSQSLIAPAADHYSILRQFNPGYALFEAALALLFGPS